MQRTKAPFRADHVGSFLRPAALKEARAKREQGAITAAELKAVEDREIEKIIKKQEEIGLKLATDGEFRRSWWHFDFLGMLDGVELYESDQGIQFRGVQTKAQSLRIVGKVGFSNHPMLEHFKFLKAHTSVLPKMTIPAPPVLHFRLAKDGIKKSVYPDLDGFFHDLGQAYKQAVKGFYDAGCRYLQFDDTVWAYLCSQEELRKARERMSNVDQLQGIYARVINATATSWNTTAIAPAASSRCASCRKATRPWCSGSSPPRAARSRRRTTSSGGSTRRPSSLRWSSSASRRNAASPPPRRATSSLRRSNGRSFA